MKVRPVGRLLFCFLTLFSSLLACLVLVDSGFAQGTPVVITFGGAEPPDIGTSNDPGNTTMQLMEFTVFPPTLPRDMTAPAAPSGPELEEAAPTEEAEPAAEGEEKAEEAEKEEVAPPEELNLIGTTLSFESFSNDATGRDGNVYGINGLYEREMQRFKVGGVLDYRYFDIDETYAPDFSSNRMAGVVYGDYTFFEVPFALVAGGIGQVSYTIDDQIYDDFATFGGGAYLSLVKAFDFMQLSAGATYLYTKYDIDADDDYSHLIQYGLDVGVPIGKRFSASVFFAQTWNVTDLERDIYDKDFFNLGIELVVAVARSWVVSGGYRTVLDLDDYTSNLGYLGTLRKF